jgi:hypothetical protein
MQESIQVYAAQDTPGLRYVLSFICETWFGLEYSLIHDPEHIHDTKLAINYSTEHVPGTLQIQPVGNPFDAVQPAFPEVFLTDWDGIPCFFSSPGSEIPFDLFGAVFFLLSRAEEYREGPRDVHGRFLAAHSVFANSGIIERPIIDEWLMKLRNILTARSQSFQPVDREYNWLNTLDIDVAYAYKYRPARRFLGGMARDITRFDVANLKKRFRVILGKESDPFDTYDHQLEIVREFNAKTLYFFLIGDKGKYDKNISHKSRGLRHLIQTVSTYAEVGIHPSYASNGDRVRLQTEVNRLEAILEKDIKKSRQHYLKVHLPQTYRDVIAAGIVEDYSLGYVDRPGFRSGTCTPHCFYDFDNQEATALKVFPLAAMDATLRDYMGLKPNEAEAMLEALISRVRAVNGTFISLWHNESLSDVGLWEGWRDVYTSMAKEAANGMPT